MFKMGLNSASLTWRKIMGGLIHGMMNKGSHDHLWLNQLGENQKPQALEFEELEVEELLPCFSLGDIDKPLTLHKGQVVFGFFSMASFHLVAKTPLRFLAAPCSNLPNG